MHKTLVFVLCLITLVLIAMPISAQDQQLILVCISPQNPEIGQPYLLVFRNVDSIGVVVPDDSAVEVYSAAPLTADEYVIAPDAATGGYRPITYIANASAEIAIPRAKSCQNDTYAEFVTPDLRSTIPLPVSAGHAVIIRFGSVQAPPPTFLGVFAFWFNPPEEEFAVRVQVIQLDPRNNIDLTIPMYSPTLRSETNYIVMGNKSFSIQDLLTEEIEGEIRFAASRQALMNVLGTANIDLFVIMRSAQVRVYPDSGISSGRYPHGGYLRLQVSADQSIRNPAFEAGSRIRPLEGTGAGYYLLTQPNQPFGALASRSAVGDVIRVDSETGRLIIRDPDGEDEVFIEAWLVEVCTDC